MTYPQNSTGEKPEGKAAPTDLAKTTQWSTKTGTSTTPASAGPREEANAERLRLLLLEAYDKALSLSYSPDDEMFQHSRQWFRKKLDAFASAAPPAGGDRERESFRQINAVLYSAYCYDKSPHLLFMAVATMAQHFATNDEQRPEIVRLMNDAAFAAAAALSRRAPEGARDGVPNETEIVQDGDDWFWVWHDPETGRSRRMWLSPNDSLVKRHLATPGGAA